MTTMSNKQMTKFQKALEEARKVFTDVDLDSIAAPIESMSDIIREAASVIAYFDLQEKFREETCRNCEKKFAYGYYITAIKCCSIPCMAEVLKSMGLSWDHRAPLERRWGRYVPAIVPSVVYEIIQEQTPPIKEGPAQELSEEAKRLIEELNQLA